MKSVTKTVAGRCVFKMDSGLKMMSFVSTMMNFVFKMMNYVFKMMNFALKNTADVEGAGSRFGVDRNDELCNNNDEFYINNNGTGTSGLSSDIIETMFGGAISSQRIMNFVFKIMDFALQMMVFALKMMSFDVQNAGVVIPKLERDINTARCATVRFDNEIMILAYK